MFLFSLHSLFSAVFIAVTNYTTIFLLLLPILVSVCCECLFAIGVLFGIVTIAVAIAICVPLISLRVNFCHRAQINLKSWRAVWFLIQSESLCVELEKLCVCGKIYNIDGWLMNTVLYREMCCFYCIIGGATVADVLYSIEHSFYRFYKCVQFVALLVERSGESNCTRIVIYVAIAPII